MKDKQELFNLLIKDLNEININKEFKYIGTGNPLSDILIIGKETAFEIDSEQYEIETLKNFKFWKNKSVLKKNEFNPRYPYQGQFLKKDNRKGNNGTSVTWMNYQKLINYIYDSPKNKNINFHNNCFITEVNSTPSKKTAKANSNSIEFRKEKVLNSFFFNSFKIIIISGVGYFNISKNINEIESIFKVKFTEKRNIDGKPSQPLWIHKDETNTKLLINCYQLSINISDNLLKEIAIEIKKSNILKTQN